MAISTTHLNACVITLICILHTCFATQIQQCIAKPGFDCDAMTGKLCPECDRCVCVLVLLQGYADGLSAGFAGYCHPVLHERVVRILHISLHSHCIPYLRVQTDLWLTLVDNVFLTHLSHCDLRCGWAFHRMWKSCVLKRMVTCVKFFVLVSICRCQCYFVSCIPFIYWQAYAAQQMPWSWCWPCQMWHENWARHHCPG